MSTDLKLIQYKIIQSERSFGYCLGNLGMKLLTNVPIPFARDNLPGLVSNITSNAINNFERKMELREQENDLVCSFQTKIWMVLLKS